MDRELSQATGAPLAAVRVLGQKAFTLMIRRDFNGVKYVLEQMTHLLGTMKPVHISFYHIIRARLSQYLGDPVDGLFHADLVLKMALAAEN